MDNQLVQEYCQQALEMAQWLSDFSKSGQDYNDSDFKSITGHLSFYARELSEFAKKKRYSIPTDQLVHGGLYEVNARNFNLAVYNQNTQGFIGVREKFGREYLDTEYYYEATRGTASAYKLLEMCPVADVSKGEDNTELFDWIKKAVTRYAKH